MATFSGKVDTAYTLYLDMSYFLQYTCVWTTTIVKEWMIEQPSVIAFPKYQQLYYMEINQPGY